MIVQTQAELDQAIADGVDYVEIRSPRGVWIEVTACDSSTVRAYGSSTVTACDSSTVTACDSSTVRAYDSSTVTACDSSTVRAYDSSTVTAYGSSTVTACDSSTVRAYDSSTVTAGSHTAVHLHSGRAHIEGGVLIDHTAIDQSTPAVWADYHGAGVAEDTVTVYKAVRDDYRSAHGLLYQVGTEVTCDDWRDTDACGNGLHFSPTPVQASAYDHEATRFLECAVLLSELRPITDSSTAKCKSRRAQVVREVDIAGCPLELAAS